MSVLPTHKHSLTYLEHARVVAADDRLAYLKADGAIDRTFSLPYANSNILLLGPGTSITQQAARLLASEGVCIAFSAGGGTPLFLVSVSEYRPTEYMQGWAKFWYDEAARLRVAKHFQRLRAHNVVSLAPDYLPADELNELVAGYLRAVESARDNTQLLLAEARYSKQLYALHSQSLGVQFTRTPRSSEPLNQFIDAGNYMAYGFANCALWVLGISYSLGVNHGMTRRGALIFDLADVFKDAIVLPCAFTGCLEKDSESRNRARLLVEFEKVKTLKAMLDAIVGAIAMGELPGSDEIAPSSKAPQ